MSHRKPPLSRYKPGFCPWCDQKMQPYLKKDGTPRKIQPSMHRECSTEYWAAQNLRQFREPLIQRDGKACKCCGEEDPQGRYDYDHVVPLWKVRRLPNDQRKEYFKLGNMQRLCTPCHKKKTAKEAAERAHHKRLKKPKKASANKIPSRPFNTAFKRKFNGEVVWR